MMLTLLTAQNSSYIIIYIYVHLYFKISIFYTINNLYYNDTQWAAIYFQFRAH